MAIKPIPNQLYNPNNLPLDVRSITEKSMSEAAATLSYFSEGMLIYSIADKQLYIIDEADENGNIIKYSKANQAEDRINVDGKNYIVLKKDVDLTEQIVKSNTIYEVRYDFDLDIESINIPEGCILYFTGGSFDKGTISGSKVNIIAGLYKIFGKDLEIDHEFTITNGEVYPEWFGAKADGVFDSTQAIQRTIDFAYNKQVEVVFQSGSYLVTRSLYVYDGIKLRGAGIYNTILKTLFSDSYNAKNNVAKTKGPGNTITANHGGPMKVIDYKDGHNRFYIGDGNIGYYDADRATNPQHPLYYPEPSNLSKDHEIWVEWNNQRLKIESQGRFIGPTGREGYGGGLIKSSQHPGLRHTTLRTDPSYNPIHPGGTIHTGIRNVTISNMQINTNSINRGKDSAIDFKYDASAIPSTIRDTYDSSVLNCRFDNLYIFGCGKDGISATRAVDWTITNCYIRQCAETGINLDGVTSINISGVYANSCIESGYKLIGCNYSSITACAADSCGIAYNIKNCRSITLNSCGAEASRLRLITKENADMEQEVLFKGRSYAIVGCKGVTLNSCYGMAAHTQDTIGAYVSFDVEDDLGDSGWEHNSFVYCHQSSNVSINNCYFKAFRRIRSAPYRNDNNEKVSYTGGTYNPSVKGSRYWQLQNYLPGQVYEIIGDSSENNITIVTNDSEQKQQKELEIRWQNLDILDPGIVPNPKGYDTAGKTISGEDGNGGWTYTTDSGEVLPLTKENFEVVCPINGKHSGGTRDMWWAWRNSLILLRIVTDEKMVDAYGEKGNVGYDTLLFGNITEKFNIDWSDSYMANIIEKCSIDIVSQYSQSTMIDGSTQYYGYGNLYKTDYTESAYPIKSSMPIPAAVKYNIAGDRISINTNDYNNLPKNVNKAALSISGNKDVQITEEIQTLIDEGKLTQESLVNGDVLSLWYPNSLKDTVKQMFGIYDKDGQCMFGISNDKKNGILTSVVNNKEHKFISPSNTNYISELTTSATSEAIINKINELIKRLKAHGFVDSVQEGSEVPEVPEIPGDDIGTFDPVTIEFTNYQSSNDELSINYSVTSLFNTIYKIGFAYSGTNTMPTTNQNSVVDDKMASDTEGKNYVGSVTIPRKGTNTYLRLYYETSPSGGASNRTYDSNVYVWTGDTLTLVS